MPRSTWLRDPIVKNIKIIFFTMERVNGINSQLRRETLALFSSLRIYKSCEPSPCNNDKFSYNVI